VAKESLFAAGLFVDVLAVAEGEDHYAVVVRKMLIYHAIVSDAKRMPSRETALEYFATAWRIGQCLDLRRKPPPVNSGKFADYSCGLIRISNLISKRIIHCAPSVSSCKQLRVFFSIICWEMFS